MTMFKTFKTRPTRSASSAKAKKMAPMSPKQAWQSFQLDHSGVAAVEFAIIAPVMLMMYFGLAEVATAISTDRRISHGANVAGDMITQAPETSREDATEILSAALRVMNVRENTDQRIKIDIQSFIRDSDDNIESRGRVLMNHASTPPAFKAEDLDPRLLSQNSGIVVTRVSYEYSPITMRETFMLKPRRSELVDIAPIEVAGVRETDTLTVCEGRSFQSVQCLGTVVNPG